MNLPNKNTLPENDFWKYFLLICSIPHPSGHEKALREALIAEADKHHLTCRVDAAGNLAIDRPAAAGKENLPAMILQAHLDMVPQAAANVEFDFLRDRIEPVIENDWVTTGNRTTLGADDGVGIALAMELLTASELQCGALRAVFTVSEETGLGGAEDIAPEFLDAAYLINLDSDEPFVVGCAGGARFSGDAVLDSEDAPANTLLVKFSLKGMQGGHSGEDIHKNVGSAVTAMAGFLQQLQALEVRIAAADGGTLHNAIARSAEVFAVLPPEHLPFVQTYADKYAALLNEKYIPAAGEKITLTVEKASAAPEKVLTLQAQSTLYNVWQQLPHGLLEVTDSGESATSCNLARISGRAGGTWEFELLARSIYNQKRDQTVERAMEIFRQNNFTISDVSKYSSWEPKWESEFLDYACKVTAELTGKSAQKMVIHGGLEPGIFCEINPELDMISFAPHMENLHSPQEKLSITSAESARKLLRRLVEKIHEV